MSQVIVVGSFNVDHVWRCDALPLRGQTLAGEYSTGPGGKGFNQAIAAARSGGLTTFICSLGDDDGAALARRLAADASLQLVAFDAVSPTGTAGIWVDSSGHNSIVIGAGANGELSESFVASHGGSFGSARVVLAQLENPLPAITHALRLGRANNVVTILNPAPAVKSLPVECLSLVDILTPNETELQLLADAPDVSASMSDEELHAICRRVLPHGTVVLTLGENGSFVSHGDDLRGDAMAFYRVGIIPAKTVDTTGAGDAFNGALAATFRHDGVFKDRIQWASAYAAMSTESPGAAMSMPLANDVTERFGARFGA